MYMIENIRCFGNLYNTHEYISFLNLQFYWLELVNQTFSITGSCLFRLFSCFDKTLSLLASGPAKKFDGGCITYSIFLLY